MIIRRPVLLLPSLSPDEAEATLVLNWQKQAQHALRGECPPGITLYLVERAKGIDNDGIYGEERRSYITYSVHKLSQGYSMMDITEFVSMAATTDTTSWDLVHYGDKPGGLRSRVALFCHNPDLEFIARRISLAIWGEDVDDAYDIQVI